MYYARKNNSSGVSLIEVVVGAALFLIVAISAYSAFTSLFQLANGGQARMLAVELADEQFEIIRNMPYTSVGLTDGIPLGILPRTQNLTRGGTNFVVDLTIRNISLGTSSVQASNKLVEVNVDCPGCKYFAPIVLTGQISPANLQSAGNGGALIIQVLDSKGAVLPDADVTVQSLATSTVSDSDVTNNSGLLNIIGVPPGTAMYRIVATKDGYTTDRTYPLGSMGSSTPTNQDPNVQNQQPTQVTLTIDNASSLRVSSVSLLCEPVAGFDFSLTGANLIGTNPDYPKFSHSTTTNASGVRDITGIDGDTYTLIPLDSDYDIAGINPFSPLKLNAGNAQSVQLVTVPKNGNSLMVSVTKASDRLPLSGATVELSRTGYDKVSVTGEGYISQTDWSGGSGQADFTDKDKYWADSGGFDVSASSGNIVLESLAGLYNAMATATLESSTFDTGTTSNFYTFSWKPLSQPVAAGPGSVKFQFAANPTATTSGWTYLGPDGTPDSYFSVPGASINSVQNGNEFVRYMAYLNTATSTVTPSVSDVNFAYTSGCIPPGQVLFQDLSAGSEYNLSVSAPGLETYNGTITVDSGWQSVSVPLSTE